MILRKYGGFVLAVIVAITIAQMVVSPILASVSKASNACDVRK